MTPYEYLQNLAHSDRGPEHDEAWMTTKLQTRWPGNYHVEKYIDYEWQYVEYRIVFASAKDETWFNLQMT